MKNFFGIVFLLLPGCLFFADCIPDYSDEKYWAALPGKNDSADLVPKNAPFEDNQANASADVFFIHPTTFYSIFKQNAPVDDKKVNDLTDRTSIKLQASVFNGSCRIYAPRYRQASLYVFVDKQRCAGALDIAYHDIRNAFMYYLEKYNCGRPVVIASHSQGTWHAITLLNDFFEDNDGLRALLVAAYLIGGPVQRDEFKKIPACDSAGQIGCYITWNTMLHDNEPLYKNCRSVNPLSWASDTLSVSAAKNIGSVPRTFDRIDVNLVGAKCAPNGALWIDRPGKKGYPGIKNFHLCDYGLFYMNLRENVKQRVEKWEKMHSRLENKE